MRKSTPLIILLLTLALPAEAAAITAPPPSSQADQYYETLPGAWGPTSPDSTKTAKDAVREGKLTAVTARVLQAQGPEGRGVADVVAKVAPPGVARQGRGSGEGSSPRGSGEGSSLSSISFPAPDKQGMGVLFPLILLATLAAALTFAMDRRRRSSAE